jgi:hypothetical protein
MTKIGPKTTPTGQTKDLPILQAAYDSPGHDDPSHRPQGSLMWPSEIYSRYSTVWLGPNSTKQLSANSPLLRKEIEAHEITRKMLQDTEHRRLKAMQSCEWLHYDICNWSAAYNNILHVLGKRDKELAHQRADNEALKRELQDLGVL